jgi:hypothetical protein
VVVRTVLARLAAPAPVPVFAVAGAGAGAAEALQNLRMDERLRLVDVPRHAAVLVLVGELTEPVAAAAVAAHDALTHPRATVRWVLPGGVAVPPRDFPEAVTVEGESPVLAIRAVWHELLSGARRSEPPLQPDEDPVPWRGVGPYGQGGSGMTGGVPYGRPLANRADDRDGLALDALPVTVGPLFSAFPDGLTARVTFHGDVVASVEIGDNPFAGTGGFEPSLFVRSLHEHVPVRDVELARAVALLRWAADAVRLQGLGALGRRILALAAAPCPPGVAEVRRLRRCLAWAQVSGWHTRHIGLLSADVLRGLGAGPVARAAGIVEDARVDDPAYRELGFAPITHVVGDAAARWSQRLAEVEQALVLADHAGDRRTGGIGVVESPRGRLEADDSPTDRLLPLLPEILAGLEWGDAVTTLNSLDLDLREAASVQPLGAAQGQ